MRTYWIESLLIAALFTLAMGFTLAQAEGNDNNTNVNSKSAVPDYVYGNKSGVVPDYVYGGGGNAQVGVAPLGAGVTLQPLTATGNPYAGQYNNFDRWMYRNLDNGYLRTTITSAGGNLVISHDIFNPAARDLRVPVLVDQNGYMLPSTSPAYIVPQFIETVPLVNPAASAASAAPGSIVTVDTANPMVTVTAAPGDKVAVKDMTAIRPQIALTYTKPMSDAEYKQFREAQIAAAAKVLPTMPSWIEALHPDAFELLPNGGVLIPADAGGVTNTVTVYSPTGSSLGTVNNPAEWHKFFADNYDVIAAKAKAQGWDLVEHDGYILLQDHTTGKVEAVFDWDGKPLETNALQARPYYFTPLRWANVAAIAAAQRGVPAAGRKPDAQKTVGTEH